MRSEKEIRQRYLRDPISVRLGELASSLAGLEGISSHPRNVEAACRFLDESRHFLVWTAREAEPAFQTELAELAEELDRWRSSISEIWSDSERRATLQREAGIWSRRVLERSGLLQTEGTRAPGMTQVGEG